MHGVDPQGAPAEDLAGNAFPGAPDGSPYRFAFTAAR
jgi:hypothetical protein